MTSSAESTAIRSGARRRVAGPRRRTDTPGTTTSSNSPTATPTSPKAAVAPHAFTRSGHESLRRARLGSGRGWLPVAAAGLALALLVAVLVVCLRPRVTQADEAAAVGSARTTLESLLSYTGKEFDAHVSQVTPQLAAPFQVEFAKVATAEIKPMAVKNGATVQARVYDAGVMDTSGGGGEGTTVRVMAFVNQATTTTAQPTPQIDQNRVIATMKKVGDRWLVSGLEAY